jgi:hypothetical protein
MSPMSEDYRIQGPVNPSELIRQGNGHIRETENLIEQNKEKQKQIVFFINESKLSKCPEVEIEIKNGIKFRAILDSESEVSLLSERVYEQLIEKRAEVPVTTRKCCTSNGLWKMLKEDHKTSPVRVYYRRRWL